MLIATPMNTCTYVTNEIFQSDLSNVSMQIRVYKEIMLQTVLFRKRLEKTQYVCLLMVSFLAVYLFIATHN